MTTSWWYRLLSAATLAAATGCHVQAADLSSHAASQLESLAMVDRPADDGTYRRAAFGPAWSDVDGNHCRQRVDVLFRTLERSQPHIVRKRGHCAHDVVAGSWIDSYTGQRMTFTNLHDSAQARAIPVDHA